ncbi:MAG: A/G-specific adenine glycosylase [Bacteroidales bacterium]|jgi:A/G-specific adenine glycosylase
MDFTTLLMAWFRDNQRALPWKEYNDAYSVWVSEIILQQTRVQQGKMYFIRFLEAFPTIDRLAEAPEDQVLKIWQGLGYYSRARNMHKTAKKVMREYGGSFPKDTKSLQKLDGIGPYTAAAIGSFAFGLPVAALDGNGYRILARYFGIDIPVDSSEAKRSFAALAQSLLPAGNSASFNQALMDFGSLICTPRPVCGICPMAQTCNAYREGQTEKLPVKKEKAAVKKRYFHYLDIDFGNATFIRQRKGNDIWKGLYEFPLIETSTPAGYQDLIITEDFRKLLDVSSCILTNIYRAKTHKLSHQTIYPVFYRIRSQKRGTCLKTEYLEIDRKDLSRYAVSRLIEKYMDFFHNFAGL